MAAKPQNPILTIAAVRKTKEKGVTEYLFNETPEVFTLREGKRKEEADTRIRKALKKGAPVKASLDLKRGLIKSISTPGTRQSAKFMEAKTFLDKPSKPRKIQVQKIDPMTFNIVDYKLKFPPFPLCQKVVPSFNKAKEIFDYCAEQSCHLPGPYDISPCIPFQYVRDGCYARAHKMRKIIKGYGYCCEKVFSFANQDNDHLAVTADKWGGCCVTWWYHVAPLVRVRFKWPMFGKKLSLTLAMVIDPGMFDKPVLLSSWLDAQEKTACNANANVSMYSIQPGTAYGPANYAGTAFTTDPSYTQTDATLLAYSGLVTC